MLFNTPFRPLVLPPLIVPPLLPFSFVDEVSGLSPKERSSSLALKSSRPESSSSSSCVEEGSRATNDGESVLVAWAAAAAAAALGRSIFGLEEAVAELCPFRAAVERVEEDAVAEEDVVGAAEEANDDRPRATEVLGFAFASLVGVLYAIFLPVLALYVWLTRSLSPLFALMLLSLSLLRVGLLLLLLLALSSKTGALARESESYPS